MVFFFTSSAVSPSATIFVGKDKFENEDLIEFGIEKDGWYCGPKRWNPLTRRHQFHVDNLSSAHVYLRLRDGESWDHIPQPLLDDCAQLTKANSIEGNKKDNVTIIYTPWSNLQKDGSMQTGQVSFHNPKLVRKVFVPTRENAIVNRLNKTRVTKTPDLRAERDEYVKKKQREERRMRDEQRARDKQEKREREQLKWQKDHAYDDLMSEENLEQSNNQNRDPHFLDDFM